MSAFTRLAITLSGSVLAPVELRCHHNVSERTGDVDTGSLMSETSTTQIITYAENHTLPNNVSQWTIDAGIGSLMSETQQTTNSQNHTSPYNVSEGTGDADIVSLMTSQTISNAENHTLSYNVSGWTDYADLGSLMPETTTTKPITNSTKKKSPLESIDLPDILCGLCRQQEDKELLMMYIVTTSTTTSTTQTTTASSTTTAAIDQQSILQIGPIVGGAVAGIILVVVLVGLVQKPGDAADVDDTSAQNAVDSNNRKAKKDQSPDPDVDRTLIPVHSYLELEPDNTYDNTYDYVTECGLRPKMALPPPPDDKGGPLSSKMCSADNRFVLAAIV
ncbi:hypothetical protein DPMN_123962 [Dreissena polymorpha]|uniref:Uncharacterized protein n=1 Tax=Dreissena polymorpha TaxID=45954 RepID=A0A9D4GRW4_DREPO|nr:hypothetical protein DPMN_123962 [Dreissena polymorpha]